MAVPDSPPHPDAATAARAAPHAARHLVVWVGSNAQAEPLVRHASRLAQSAGLSWTVICVETPGEGRDPGARPVEALKALKLAETLGASAACVNANSVIEAVVERVHAEHASMVLIGGQAAAGWLEGLPRPWLGSLADALSARLPEVAIDVVYFPETQPAGPPHRAAQRPRMRAANGALRAAAVVGLCLLVSEALLPYLEHASVAVVYLAGVVYVALRHGQSAAMLAVVLSILLFDLLVVEPRWSFKPTDPQYYFTFLVMAVVGILVSRLAEQARQQARVAEARARRAQALNDLASHLVAAGSDADIATGLTTAVRTTFGVASELLLPSDSGRLPERPGFIDAPERELAQRCFDQGRAEESNRASRAPLLCVPLQGLSRPLGVLVVRLAGEVLGMPEDRRLLDAFTNQAALALQRWSSERRSASAAVDAETERLRNTLLSGISHDFRTPLTTILGSATSLLEQREALDAPERIGLLQSIRDEAQRMHAAMSDLLDLTRMEEGAVSVRSEWCPADDLVAEARATLGARLRDRTLRIDVPRDAIVWCDPRLVQQALVNLIDNALRHTPPSSTIDVRIEAAAPVWRLIVADDGPGLPAGMEREVFKKFARVREEPAHAGAGLGLAICAAVARLHRGSIAAANADGARFTLTLPQPTAPDAVEDAA